MPQIPIPTSGQQTPLRTADHGRTDGRPAQGLVRFLVFHPRAGVIVLVWIALNLAAWMGRWDPYPFILLNLVFSTQAAYAAPLLLLSQNRQAERDRVQSEHDFRVNQLALQYLFAWHRDAHGADCGCVRQLRADVDAVLAELADDLVTESTAGATPCSRSAP
jgi:uncharacterized membrane protein